MQERLDTTMAEVNAQGSEIDRLKGAIQGKSAPLKVAQTRLNMRTQRTRRYETQNTVFTRFAQVDLFLGVNMPGQKRRQILHSLPK